jgi:predicted small secreted protein
MRRMVFVVALVLAGGLLTAGCDTDASAGCGAHKGECQVSLSDGGSLSLDGQKLTVERLDHDTVTFDAHGIDLTLSRSTDLSFGRYHLHFGGTTGSSVSIDVSQ